ncbi:MAG TPA: polysaccharide deacetylase family protein [Vicinamibacterales bacterium]
MTSIIKNGLLSSGWYGWRLGRDRLPGVLVLCYHGIRPDAYISDGMVFSNLHMPSRTFEGHLRVISQCCHPISLGEWRHAITTGRPLPKRAVLVTFDDGYRSVFTIARPMLKRYGISASIFVCSEPIRQQQLFWFDAMARTDGEAAVMDAIAHDSVAASKRSQASPATTDDPLAPLTVDQLKTLADEGFEIGAHTATHARLAAASETDQTAEITRCRDMLSGWLRRPVTTLAYPWGQPGVDYTRQTVEIAERLGFDFAFTTNSAFAGSREAPLERSRFVVLASVRPAELAHRITYSWR